MTPLVALREAVEAATASIAGDRGAVRSPPTLERPKKAGFGDYATNAAMLLAPVVGAPPRDVAGQVGEALAEALGPQLDRVEVAGPGFLNLFLSDDWHAAALAHVLEAGDAFGAGEPGSGEAVNVEFVSANPTGPMHVGHARNAAYGDAVARLLELRGDRVTREYYVNDYGSQVLNLGRSIQARARGEEPPEDGYHGDYVRELAGLVEGAADGDPLAVARRGLDILIERNRESLHRFRIDFDVWFSERSLHEGSPSRVDDAFTRLDGLGETYRSEGALWLRTTAHGDDKDRVLERSSGEHTYFASDLGYMLDKRERSFDRFIFVLGADHHGYVKRMEAAFASLGGDVDALELVIMQFVHLVERGERASMSKRRGEFVTLDDLVEEIGVDAARWFLLGRSHDTTIDLDLDLAREESNENPVFYVQYAHARIASILRKAGGGEDGVPVDGAPGELHPSERALIKKILSFADEAAEAAERRAPHRVAAYALELAQAFTAFYRDCKVVGVPEEAFRLAQCRAAQRTIARSLDLLGVDAPESM